MQLPAFENVRRTSLIPVRTPAFAVGLTRVPATIEIAGEGALTEELMTLRRAQEPRNVELYPGRRLSPPLRPMKVVPRMMLMTQRGTTILERRSPEDTTLSTPLSRIRSSAMIIMIELGMHPGTLLGACRMMSTCDDNIGC